MTTWYSDHIGADGDNDTSLPATPTIVPGGLGHAKLYCKRARFTGLPLLTAPDVVRMFTLRSSDRLHRLAMSSDGGCTAGAVDVGLYLSGANHDGAVVDVDLFCSAKAVSSALDEFDAFAQATTLTGVDRGKTLWEQAAVGAASYTADPYVLFDVCLTVTTAFTVADCEVTLFAEYTQNN